MHLLSAFDTFSQLWIFSGTPLHELSKSNCQYDFEWAVIFRLLIFCFFFFWWKKKKSFMYKVVLREIHTLCPNSEVILYIDMPSKRVLITQSLQFASSPYFAHYRVIPYPRQHLVKIYCTNLHPFCANVYTLLHMIIGLYFTFFPWLCLLGSYWFIINVVLM